MRLCDNEHMYQSIMEYILPRCSKCLYIYLDLMRYGIKNEDVRAWADDYEDISTVAMRYHNGMHICADRDANYCDLANLISAERPAIVLGERKTIDRLSMEIRCFRCPSYGVVMKAENINSLNIMGIERANERDAHEIAKLIMTDSTIGSGYTVNELASQISERLKDGYARNYVIRKNGDIIAHAGTGAEFGGVATIVDVIVRPDYRRQGLGKQLVAAISSDLNEEGMTAYLFCYSTSARKLYQSVGYEFVCEWARIESAR